MKKKAINSILTVGGSDTSGGAGIQGDIKTIAAHGFHGVSVISAITAQNTVRITTVEVSKTFGQQLEAIKEDIPVFGIKIGMLYTRKNVLTVAAFIEDLQSSQKDDDVVSLRSVLDPLMMSSTGKVLCKKNAINAMATTLFPHVTLITPNRMEAEFFLGKKICNAKEMEEGAAILSNRFKTSVLIKGGHLDDVYSTDVLYNYERGECSCFERLKREFSNTHGTGCALSSAITCRLAQGYTLEQSVALAKDYVYDALENGYSIGKGEGPVDGLLQRITEVNT